MAHQRFRPDPSMEDMIRRAQARPALRSQARSQRFAGPGGAFWTLWIGSTFGPLGLWIVYLAASVTGPGMVWCLIIALAVGLTNLYFAAVTEGYTTGNAALGYGIAFVLNAIVLIMGTVVVAGALLVSCGVLKLINKD